MTTAATPTSTVRIGRYTVEAKLGEGGMAETWLCRFHGAKGFSKQVVVKTLKPENRTTECETMFLDEARIGARIEHANVPRVVEFGQTSGNVPFLVQEYVDGPSVAQILTRQSWVGDFDLRFACRLVADIAGALEWAHHAPDEAGRPLNVVHRDVSPSNILVSRRGVPKLIDFGVAKFDGRESQTEAGVLKGKLRYMAPEVLLHGDASHQSDLYSLGIVLYSLCVGEPPWATTGSSGSFTGDVRAQVRGSYATPSSRRPAIDVHLDTLIERCLHPDRAQRFRTGTELRDALNDWLTSHGGPVGDDELAERIARLFPDGSADWRADDVTVASLRSAVPPLPRLHRPHVRLALVTLAVGGTLVLALLVGASVGLWAMWTWPVHEGPSVAASAIDDDQLGVLLDAAEVALQQGRLSDASSRLTSAAALPTDDAELRERREALQAAHTLRASVVAIRELAASDVERALEQARGLVASHPRVLVGGPHPPVLVGQDEVFALISELEQALPVVIPVEDAPAPAPARPRTRAADGPRTPSDLLRTRSERAPDVQQRAGEDPNVSEAPVGDPVTVPPAPDEVLLRRTR